MPAMILLVQPPSREAEERILQQLRDLFAHPQDEDSRPPVPGQPAEDLERLFAAHSDRVYALCLKLTRDPDRARDLTQETMLKAWQKLPSFRRDSGLGTWLHVIARNLCFQSVRKRSMRSGSSGRPDAAPRMGRSPRSPKDSERPRGGYQSGYQQGERPLRFRVARAGFEPWVLELLANAGFLVVGLQESCWAFASRGLCVEPAAASWCRGDE